MTDSPFEVIRIENDHCGSNAFLLFEPQSSSALVIDPADISSHRVCEQLARKGFTKVLIVLTHEHFDHMSGVSAIRESFDTTLVASRECSRRICDPRTNLSRYSIGIDLSCEPADLICEELPHNFVWGHMNLEFIPTPGHSAGGICVGLDRYLFTGDTLIPGYPTVVKLPGGDQHALEFSFDSLFKKFSPEIIVYPGHGNTCRLGDLAPAAYLAESSVDANHR